MAPAHRIDTHHHIVPPKYLAGAREEILKVAHVHSPKVLAWTPAASIEAMDRAGVATAVTSISSPGVWFGDAAGARAYARDCNEYAAQMARDYKGRFGVFASLPLPDIDGSLREIEHALDVLKADGIGLMTHFGKVYAGDPSLAPIYDELNRRKAVVYYHPTTPGYCSDLLPEIPPPMIEFPFDTTRAILTLLYSGMVSRCPDIRFIFSHAGGALPMLAHRIANVTGTRPELKERLPKGVMYEFGKFHYDVVNASNPISFGSIRQLAGISQLLFGSDFPFWSPEMTSKALAELKLDAADLRAIERDNALRLFPRFR